MQYAQKKRQMQKNKFHSLPFTNFSLMLPAKIHVEFILCFDCTKFEYARYADLLFKYNSRIVFICHFGRFTMKFIPWKTCMVLVTLVKIILVDVKKQTRLDKKINGDKCS